MKNSVETFGITGAGREYGPDEIQKAISDYSSLMNRIGQQKPMFRIIGQVPENRIELASGISKENIAIFGLLGYSTNQTVTTLSGLELSEWCMVESIRITAIMNELSLDIRVGKSRDCQSNITAQFIDQILALEPSSCSS